MLLSKYTGIVVDVVFEDRFMFLKEKSVQVVNPLKFLSFFGSLRNKLVLDYTLHLTGLMSN